MLSVLTTMDSQRGRKHGHGRGSVGDHPLPQRAATCMHDPAPPEPAPPAVERPSRHAFSSNTTMTATTAGGIKGKGQARGAQGRDVSACRDAES